MRIRIIGSGNMWTSYHGASYVVDDSIIIDCPNGMCKALLKMNINPTAINNMLITHFHGDHYFDVPFYFLLKSRADDRTVNLYCGKEGKKKIYRLTKMAFPNSVDEIISKTNLTYNFIDKFMINNYYVERLLVDHGRMKPSYGYIFSKDNVKVGFTGDSTICKNVEYMASTCKYLFCDCSFVKGTAKHMGIDMIQDLANRYPNCTFVTSHMDDITRKELNNLNINNILVPEDGLCIEVAER